ncbi:MAG TPA: hypothetical protein VG347_09135, partial [Verrucomicrobiae bacterium]|nr:hypothetical protein [Verrucomicrobiae bacterium]
THFYSDLYPGIKMSSPIALEDDEQQNLVQTTEYYSIDNAWTQADKVKKYRCDFYPSTIAAFLKKPVDIDRKLPLGLSFPRHQILRTEVTLPEAWPVESTEKIVDDPAFTFRKTYRCSGSKVVTEYEYQSLADYVPADRVSEYIQRLNQTSQSLGNGLTWR